MPGPSGDCLPYLAPQKSLKQRCHLITDYTETSRRSGMLSDIASDEEMPYWLLSSWRRKETPQDDTHNILRQHRRFLHDKAISGQLFLFLPLDTFFIPHHHSKRNLLNTRKRLEEENAVSVWQAYSPRRASHLLSDQLLKTRFSSERLPFAPVLKLKFKGKAPVECD